MVMQNILGNLRGNGLSTLIGPKPLAETQVPFKTMLVPTDGDLGAGEPAAMIAILAAMVAGQDALIWTMTVPAQQQVRWGFGSPATPMNQGYMWFGACEAAAYIEGKLRLVQANARRTLIKTVADIDDGQLCNRDGVAYTVAGMTLNDKNTMMALPEKREFKKVGEDSMLELWYHCTTAVVVTIAGFSIPITVYQ